jgi:hypothetical protein
MKDAKFDEAELEMVSGKMVEMGLQSKLDFKEEIIKYNNYKSTITNEDAYLQYLIEKINPVNDIALYSYCIEILLSDAHMDIAEDSLSNKIAAALKLETPAQEITKKLMLQRKVIETNKIV